MKDQIWENAIETDISSIVRTRRSNERVCRQLLHLGVEPRLPFESYRESGVCEDEIDNFEQVVFCRGGDDAVAVTTS